MDELILVAESDDHRLEIVKSSVGYYIYRFDRTEHAITHDYLQDDLETAMIFARDRFKVAIETWREPSADERRSFQDDSR